MGARPHKSGVALALLVMATGAACAHDFWIEPSTGLAQPGALVSMGLRQGENGVGQVVRRINSRIVRFEALGPTSVCAVVGRDDAAPAGLVRLAETGTHVVVYQSTTRNVTMPAEHFEHYLGQEGLEHIITWRHAQGQRERPGREGFQRCAKSLVRTSPGMDAGFDRVVGLPLEITPKSNPWTHTERLRCRLSFEQQPVAGILVVAFRLTQPERRYTARTDASGHVELPVQEPGVWLVKAVHMVPADADRGFDWESFWASLTFERH